MIRIFKITLSLFLIVIGLYFIILFFHQNQATIVSNNPKEKGQFKNDKLDTVINLIELKQQLDSLKQILKPQIDGTGWQGRIFPNNELVKGYEGRYYIIDLVNASTQELLQFDAGKYIINDFNENFQKGLADFGTNMINILKNNGINYKIFVKGSADMLGYDSFSSALDINYSYDHVKFFKKYQGKSKFISETAIQNIPNPFYNTHLPNLRASFIKEKLISIYFEINEPIILDGDVSLKIDEKDRNALILLFLPKDLTIIN